MTLISIIAALVAERLMGHLREYLRLDWFDSYIEFLGDKAKSILKDGWIGLVLLLIPVSVALFAIQQFLTDWILPFNLLGVAFGIVVLIYALTPLTLNADIEEYVDAVKNSDAERTQAAADKLTAGETDDVTAAIFSRANDDLFATVMWFFVAGPVGALLYRITGHAADNGDEALSHAGKGLRSIMAYVPGRLMAFTFALAGSFDGATNAKGSLAAAGVGALHGENLDDAAASALAARKLIIRSLVIWFGVLAFLTWINLPVFAAAH